MVEKEGEGESIRLMRAVKASLAAPKRGGGKDRLRVMGVRHHQIGPSKGARSPASRTGSFQGSSHCVGPTRGFRDRALREHRGHQASPPSLLTALSPRSYNPLAFSCNRLIWLARTLHGCRREAVETEALGASRT